MQVLEQEDIDVLITDENMPGTPGTELLQNTCLLYPDVIRIMMTGLTDFEVVKKAINNGEIYRFFNKPWDEFELLLCIRYALRQKTLEQENMKLKAVVGRQEQLLGELEKEHPGISQKTLAEDGSIIIESGN